jgi:pimeloyl-ACP methyl ester carboxylesterase
MRAPSLHAIFVLALAVLASCKQSRTSSVTTTTAAEIPSHDVASVAATETRPPPSPPSRPSPPSPVFVETVAVPGDLPVFAVRGARGATPIAFLHGMCSHGLGYLQSFQYAAAERGPAIALQGDLPCGAGPESRWTFDVEEIDRRIVAAFEATGIDVTAKEIVLIGYSEGASRAEAIAARWPERYSRVVLIGAPRTPSAKKLAGVRAAVMMAGERDNHGVMREGDKALRAARIPSTFILIPGARHGELGDGEKVMGEAFAWLFDRDR